MRENVLRLITILLILLFFYTAVSKFLNLNEFEKELGNQTIPSWSVPLLVWLIPLMEVLVVLLIINPSTIILGFFSSALLMFVFSGYISLVLLNVFDRVPCSCGGVLKQMDFGVHLVFNLFFLLLSITGIRLLRSVRNATKPQ